MTTITLYEKINRDRLEEVLLCSNIFETSDGDDDIEDLEQEEMKMKTMLETFFRMTETPKGIKINYTQKFGYGRFSSKNGLQRCKKNIRCYIAGEEYLDLDIENCHPVLLSQLCRIKKIDCGDQLREYVADKNGFIQKYKLKNKKTFIAMMNNSILYDDTFKETHDIIYNYLFPVLQKENKALYNRVKKEKMKSNKENPNVEGAFISLYLQNLENKILQVILPFLGSKGFVVGVMMYDGCMIEKNDAFDDEVMRECETHIKEQTGYSIRLTLKSTETPWRPIIEQGQILHEEPPEKFSNEKFDRLAYDMYERDNDGKQTGEINTILYKRFVKYVNKFACRFEDPHCYGWREYSNSFFRMRKYNDIKDIIPSSKELTLWKKNDLQLKYAGMVFAVDKNDPRLEGGEFKTPAYNRYIRPPTEPYDGDIETICPTFFYFLRDIICGCDEKLYVYLIHYISKMIQVGFTKQILVLMGEMGVGKGTFCEILTMLIGGIQYCNTINDIQRLENKFNAYSQTSILTIIEEVVSNAGDFHRINNILKSLATEKNTMIEKKGFDSFMDESNNNIVINSNHSNPIHLNNQNRRAGVLYVPTTVKKNYVFFNKLRKEAEDNIVYLRHYFNTFDYTEDLNSIRPTTEAEIGIQQINKSPIELFVEDELVLKGDTNDPYRRSSYIYEFYKDFCFTKGYKKVNEKIFKVEMERVLASALEMEIPEIFKRTKKGIYIQGFINTDFDDNSWAIRRRLLGYSQ